MDIGTSSLYTDYITSTASNNKASSLTDKAKTDYSNASDEELMDVCKEFESYFLEKIFDTMILRSCSQVKRKAPMHPRW